MPASILNSSRVTFDDCPRYFSIKLVERNARVFPFPGKAGRESKPTEIPFDHGRHLRDFSLVSWAAT